MHRNLQFHDTHQTVVQRWKELKDLSILAWIKNVWNIALLEKITRLLRLSRRLEKKDNFNATCWEFIAYVLECDLQGHLSVAARYIWSQPEPIFVKSRCYEAKEQSHQTLRGPFGRSRVYDKETLLTGPSCISGIQ
ncbi:cortexin domain-containing 1 protein isoform X1 [Rhineura floridana]|uniref:cortexin domain-containing 1 protein isoform X1 n=1 Tax=Rhineura floridana TaxID=261503 RepID=UPI002AC82528|nr:cortexin domain-containing 1 protein isoform X1 [Rhineura floridana]